MKCCNAGEKNVGKMLDENHKGGMVWGGGGCWCDGQ